MNIKLVFHVAHFIALIFGVAILFKVISLGDFSDNYRENQFRAYKVHKKCPSNLKDFRYCFVTGENAPENLIIGDSSILAFANSIPSHINSLIIGSGSCSLLSDLVVSFSVQGCTKLTNRMAELSKMPISKNIKKLYLIHRSGYLSEISREHYIESLNKTIEIFNKPNLEVILVLEPKELNFQPAQCINRLFFINKNDCNAEYSSYYHEHLRILEKHFSKYSLLTANELDRDYQGGFVFNYKDSKHITAKSFPCFYNEIAVQFEMDCSL
ncbi:MAG: hypothetical protein HRT54_05610 [Colwellia sp.]|nr:hypothetical protein [Colwellia sp.]